MKGACATVDSSSEPRGIQNSIYPSAPLNTSGKADRLAESKPCLNSDIAAPAPGFTQHYCLLQQSVALWALPVCISIAMDHRDSETQLCQEDPDSLDAPGDPTMAQCCIRDMQQQRKSAALRRQLEQVDVSTQRQQVLLHAVSPATLEQNFNADLASELHDDTDHGMIVPIMCPVPCCQEHRSLHEPQQMPHQPTVDAPFHAELARLRDLRLQQLKAEADQKQELQRHGHGQLNQHTAKDAYVRDGRRHSLHVLLSSGTGHDARSGC